MFRRRRLAEVEISPIRAFWEWWAAWGERAFTAAIGNGDFGDLPTIMGKKVSAIHPDLQGESSKGIDALHALSASAAGVAELRPISERWLRAAPRSNELWEFLAARRRDPNVLTSTLDIGGVKVDLGLATVKLEIDDRRRAVDVRIFHPAFDSVGGDVSQQITYLLLDWLLGEDDVERWIAGIETVLLEPEGSQPIGRLRDVVDELASDNAEPVWAIMESTTVAGNRLLVTALQPMRWIDHPLFDLHSTVRIDYPSRVDGLPTPESLELLRGHESLLTKAIGPRGMLVAHESFEGVRLLHFYTDSEDQNASASLESTSRAIGVKVSHSMDPSWKDVRRFS